MEKNELDEILLSHKQWIENEDGGRRANLQGANLQDANLRRADLQGAYLQGANLQDADLRRANLQGANLQDADLRRANLRSADLQGADLRSADLQGADLQHANLRDADLQDADLRRANLQDADLRRANLDFSCLPMWCGGSRFKCSPALVRQIFAHVCSLEIVGADEETTAAINSIMKEAEKSHRASDLGLI